MDLLEVTRRISDDSDTLFDAISNIKDANDKAIMLTHSLEHELYGCDDDFSPEKALSFQINYKENKILLNTISDYLFTIKRLVDEEVSA